MGTRGDWAEFNLPDGRAYYQHIITGEKTWARPIGYDHVAGRRVAVGQTHSNVYVGGLPVGTNEFSFRSLFSRFGSIVSTKVVNDLHYGFVKYTSTAEAQKCIDAMNGVAVNGMTLQVRFANKQ